MRFTQAHIKEGECIVCGEKTDLISDLRKGGDSKTEVMRVPICEKHQGQVAAMLTSDGEIPEGGPDLDMSISQMVGEFNDILTKLIITGGLTPELKLIVLLHERQKKIEEMVLVIAKDKLDGFLDKAMSEVADLLKKKKEQLDESERKGSEGEASETS